MRRELLGVVVGIGALLGSVAVVGADNAETPAPDGKPQTDIATLQSQASQLMKQIKSYYDAGQEALTKARDGSAKDRTCITDAVGRMQGPRDLANGSYSEFQQAVARNDAGEAERAYLRISSFFNMVTEAYTSMQGCGGPSNGSVIDGAPITENKNNMTTTTNPTGGEGGGNDLSGLQVSAEQSKLGSQKAVDGDGT
ncbi:MAG: hypothetical protein H6747_02705 [Deltaproteobacteria bacterium]|nr:hypothetical protein [Deltaproteobacteria bacterium]